MVSPAMATPATAAPKAVHTVTLIDLNDARKLIAKNDWTGSISLLRKIVVQQPRNADALNLLGYSLRQHGDMKEAEAWYLKALKLKPNHLGANEYLGELYALTGQTDKAKVRLATIQKICGNTSCEEYKDLAKAIAAKA
jgi:Flp pilus assembly protein TadD